MLRRTPDDLRKGLEYLREAVALDPRYGRAHAKLADAYILLAMTSDVAPKESFPHARTAAERALAIDPGLSEARVSMGIIKFWFDWDWSGAEAEFKRAIAAERPDPAAHTFYGHLLSNLGDHTGALQEMRRALDYEPHSALANALFAQCLYYQGRDDDSLAHLRKTLDLDPTLWLTHNMMGRIYGRKAMYREALLAFDRATELGGSLVVRAAAGYTLAASGRRDEARAILNQLKTPRRAGVRTAVEHRARPPRPGRAGGGAQPARRGRRRARPAPDVSDRGASLGRPGRPPALHRLARKGRPETVARDPQFVVFEIIRCQRRAEIPCFSDRGAYSVSSLLSRLGWLPTRRGARVDAVNTLRR